MVLSCISFTACGDEEDEYLFEPGGTESGVEDNTGTNDINHEEKEDNTITNGKLKGHEWINLGLPSGLKWATCNVGASTPEEFGDYFAWGETKSKKTYDWSTYLYRKGSDNAINGPTDLTKYCNDSFYGFNDFTDDRITLVNFDDAATVNWGVGWRMPTEKEQTELRTMCTWTWITQKGIKGYNVTGPNGNSIFLPAAGCRFETVLYTADDLPGSNYWSSSLYLDSPECAFCLTLTSKYVDWNLFGRDFGFSVRPVCK